MKYEVYIRGYRDSRNSGAGFEELVDYGSAPPPKWLRDTFRDLHNRLADRATTELQAEKPAGALFMTLTPTVRDDDTYFAIVYLMPVTGASGRSGYEFCALFQEQSAFGLQGRDWLCKLAQLWSGIRWQQVMQNRAPICEFGETSPPPRQLEMDGRRVDEEWVARARIPAKAPLPVGPLLMDKSVAAQLPSRVNLVIGLDQPLAVLGREWRWIRVDEALDVARAAPMPKSLKDLATEDVIQTCLSRRVVEAYLDFETLRLLAQQSEPPKDLEARLADAYLSVDYAVQLKQRLGGATKGAALVGECRDAVTSLYPPRRHGGEGGFLQDMPWWEKVFYVFAIIVLVAVLLLGLWYFHLLGS